MARYSYTSTRTPLARRLREFHQLLRMTRRPPESAVDWVVGLHDLTKARVREHTGVELRGLRGLEVGPGQNLGCMRCFSRENEMVGIDTDVIVDGATPLDYLKMLHHNSALRTFKTLGRQVLGVDRRFLSALAAQLKVTKFAPMKLVRMSATNMAFADASFDFVYSHSVFEHIDDPAAALREISRVLRPGGAAYIGVHLYTSHSGSHDPKVLADGWPTPPLWPHLRPSFAHMVHPNAYLNELRLEQWYRIFDKLLPGVVFANDCQQAEVGEGLRELREVGELAGYSDEELVTVNVNAIWQKPLHAAEKLEVGAARKATQSKLGRAAPRHGPLVSDN